MYIISKPKRNKLIVIIIITITKTKIQKVLFYNSFIVYHTGDHKELECYFESSLSKRKISNKNIILAGGLNINLLNFDGNKKVQNFVNLLFRSGMIQAIFDAPYDEYFPVAKIVLRQRNNLPLRLQRVSKSSPKESRNYTKNSNQY